MIGNRVLLKWKEPRFTLNYIKKRTSWKEWSIPFMKIIGKYALGSLILAFVVIIISYIRGGSVNNNDITLILVLTSVGLVLGLLSALTTILSINISPEVSLREKDIIIMSVSGGANIPYKEIQSCSIGKTKLEEQEIYVLEIKHWNGNESFIEIAPTVSTDDIIELLRSKSVQVTPSLFNPV